MLLARETDRLISAAVGKTTRLRNNNLDSCVSTEHVFSPVAGGRYEVYAAVDPSVGDPLLPVDVDFLLQVGFILVIDELHDGLPAVKRNEIQSMRGMRG